MDIAKHITGVKGLEAFDAAIVKAHQNEGKLAKVREGWYIVERDGEFVEIMKRNNAGDNDRLNGWWFCHQINHRWDGEPMPTLNEIKRSLGL